MNSEHPSLTIVIPALNEEASIGTTISRTLQAIPRIQDAGSVGEVRIVVVSDGSTDRTAAIARSFVESCPGTVSLVVFEHNRGYGAAITEGFRVGNGDLLSFLDADGTCDPAFFGPLCEALQEQRADVALGNRMGVGSQMPVVRRIGNHLFAFLLGILSNQSVSDTASGMRVLRRETLPLIYPLPHGLDYTPAMSARAIIQGLRIVEVPMTYAERVGDSKLRAIRDGFRFLRAIFDAVLFFNPARLFLLACSLCVVMLFALAISPTEFYFRFGRLEEWMIYRFEACFVLAIAGSLLLNAAIIADDLFFLSHRARQTSFWFGFLKRLLSQRKLLVLGVVAVASSLLLVWPGLREYAQTGHVTLHWSRVIVAAFGLLLALQCVITTSLRRIVRLWRQYLQEARPLASTRSTQVTESYAHESMAVRGETAQRSLSASN